MKVQAQDRVALVTGASGALGQAVALRLFRAGYRVACTSDDPDHAPALGASIDVPGAGAIALHGELLDPAAMTAAVGAVVEQWGRIDLLACDATWVKSDGPEAVSAALRSLCANVGEHMESEGGGTIVLLLSEDGEAEGRALRSLPHELAASLSHRGVRVTALKLGPGCTDHGVPPYEVAEIVEECAGRSASTWLPELTVRPWAVGSAPPTLSSDEQIVGNPLPRFFAETLAEPEALLMRHVIRWLAPAFYVNVGDCTRYAGAHKDDETPGARSVLPLSRMLRIIRQGARHQLGGCLVTGMSPELYPYLMETLYFCRQQGLAPVGMMTDGSGLEKTELVRRIAEAGARRWHFSWPSTSGQDPAENPATEAAIRRIQDALGVLDTYTDTAVTIYCSIRQPDLDRLDDQVRSFAGLKAQHRCITAVIFALLQPEGSAPMDPEQLYDLREAKPQLEAARARATELALPLLFNHLPGCILPEHPEYHASIQLDFTFDTRTQTWTNPHKEERIKGEACLGCRLFEGCAGYFRLYAERFGADIFQPSGDLLRDDPLPLDALTRPRTWWSKLVGGECFRPRPSEKRVESPPPTAASAEVAALLAPLLGEGSTLVEHSVETVPAPIFRGVMRPAESSENFTFFLAPSSAELARYAESEHLALWYEGADLDPSLADLLDRLSVALRDDPERDAAIAAILAT